jgi:DNA-binding NarL/FixJ family response regulator
MKRPPLRILVVDDSENVRHSICQLLESLADSVISEASDGEDAVRKARQDRPDIVLMDITMPVMNSFIAARLIKHESPSTRILMVSQYDSAAYAKEAFAAGAIGYVLKSNVFRS